MTTATSSPTPNLFILASDNSPRLLPLLRTSPSLAASQDPTGYSLLHAAASYNHLDLLRTLVTEFHTNVNITDNDHETPLFAVETVAAAKVLVEELGADLGWKSEEGVTAEEKISGEGEFVTVADYLREMRVRRTGSGGAGAANGTGDEASSTHPPPLPPNVSINFQEVESVASEVQAAGIDPEIARRIEELASKSKDEFMGEEGQRELRVLIEDSVRAARESDGGDSSRRRVA
ncbi:MAG: hypothetical protein MMC33_006602 [Icmadophila ericetorum]|nr:hypothetical protein [Icmadophila ericetorum]